MLEGVTVSWPGLTAFPDAVKVVDALAIVVDVAVVVSSDTVPVDLPCALGSLATMDGMLEGVTVSLPGLTAFPDAVKVLDALAIVVDVAVVVSSATVPVDLPCARGS